MKFLGGDLALRGRGLCSRTELLLNAVAMLLFKTRNLKRWRSAKNCCPLRAKKSNSLRGDRSVLHPLARHHQPHTRQNQRAANQVVQLQRFA